jgi:YbbR domain-containing protein
LNRLPFSLDLGRAGFALGLSVILFVFVLNETNPETTRTTDFSIPIEVVNRPPGLVVMDQPPSVQLRVRGPLEVLNRLRPTSFVAQVDASGARAGLNRLTVNARPTDPEVRNVEAVPGQVELQLEEIQERSLPVRVDTTGQVPSGYLLGVPRAEPSRVTVSGPASIVQRAVEAVVEVSVERVTVTINGAYTPRIVDARSNEIGEVTVRTPAVNVEVPITQQAQFKEIGVRPKIQGRPAPGYFLEPVEVDPPTATLVGEPSALEGASFVETAPVDVNGLSSTVVRRLALVPPPNTLLLQQGQTVDVTIRVSPLIISQTLRVAPSVANLSSGLAFTVQPDSVEVTISGPAPTLSSLTARDFRVSLDVGGLSSGRHEIEPKVENLPSGMTLERVEPNRVAVELREAPPAPTP